MSVTYDDEPADNKDRFTPPRRQIPTISTELQPTVTPAVSPQARLSPLEVEHAQDYKNNRAEKSADQREPHLQQNVPHPARTSPNAVAAGSIEDTSTNAPYMSHAADTNATGSAQAHRPADTTSGGQIAVDAASGHSHGGSGFRHDRGVVRRHLDDSDDSIGLDEWQGLKQKYTTPQTSVIQLSQHYVPSRSYNWVMSGDGKRMRRDSGSNTTPEFVQGSSSGGRNSDFI